MPRPRSDPAQDQDPDSDHFPAGLLAELLALNEEMVEQLCLERLSVVGAADLLTNLIDQHEKTAALLRAQLASRRPEYPALSDRLLVAN